MWIVAEYEPISVFGLRPSNTTSTGGKSLLIPTPYAIKMAILDRAICIFGLDYGEQYFPIVRDLRIYAQIPIAVAVTRSFQKVLRPGQGKSWNTSIVQREYVIHAGRLTLAFNHEDAVFVTQDLPTLLTSINYFGRRGGFFQLMSLSEQIPTKSFVDLCQPSEQLSLGFLQRMDDMRRDATFQDVSTYYEKGRKDNGGRVHYNIILPYQLAYHGFNHTIYKYQESTS